MKIFFLLPFVGLFLFSCDESKSTENTQTSEVSEENISIEELAKRMVESQLSIPATENYSLVIHKAHFDSDGVKDAVILVNRAQFAESEAKRRNRFEAESKLSFTGNYNYLFYYSGAEHNVSRPISITSSSFAPLIITIANIQSQSYKDFSIDYRIMENCYRNFYTIFRGVPKLVFQWSVFEFENPKTESVSFIEYAPGTYSSAKDIVIFKGKLDAPKPENVKSDFNYSISKDGEIEHLFFYNPNEGKYFTKK